MRKGEKRRFEWKHNYSSSQGCRFGKKTHKILLLSILDVNRRFPGDYSFSIFNFHQIKRSVKRIITIIYLNSFLNIILRFLFFLDSLSSSILSCVFNWGLLYINSLPHFCWIIINNYLIKLLNNFRQLFRLFFS